MPGLNVIAAAVFFLVSVAVQAASRQESLNEWRRLTGTNASPPSAWVRGDRVRLYFQGERGPVGFSAKLRELRIPTDGYKVRSAQLRLDRRLPVPTQEAQRGWGQARVIAGADWRQLTTRLLEELTPREPGHGVYYQGLLSDRLLYRDAEGVARATAMDQRPASVLLDRRYSMDETLVILARQFERQLGERAATNHVFLLMAPNARRFPQPLLIDVRQRQCSWLAPDPLYDPADRGLSLAVTLQGVTGLALESHGWALVKNPVTSLARLGDLGVQTAVRFLRWPLPKSKAPVPIEERSGMNLEKWEQWLDRYTGTHREEGLVKLLIDGEHFFPRLKQAIEAAVRHVHIDLYIFDKDDIGVEFADLLKAKARTVPVQVVVDQMGTLAAGAVPPATPLPEGFVSPRSIKSYLTRESRVQVRSFLNPWFSSDHAKLFLVDGAYAWIGGMNIGREYRYEWHDLMVEISGPVVASMEEEFRRSWAHAGPLGDLAFVGAAISQSNENDPIHPGAGWIGVRRLPTRTLWKPFSTAVQGAIHRAQRYIYVENPYLFDPRTIAGLVRARQRGVDVRVILPHSNDHAVGKRSNLVMANYFLENGVRVYFYPGMTHVKALLVDGWSCVGSGNLNHLSMRLCQEENVATSDPAFAEQLRKELFEEDFAHSDELTRPIEVGWADFLADLVIEGF